MLETRLNRFTGNVGLLVCESRTNADAPEAHLIAELLGVPGQGWMTQTDCFGRLDWLARRNQLSVVANGKRTRLTPFIVHRCRTDGKLSSWYLARLLTIGGEFA